MEAFESAQLPMGREKGWIDQKKQWMQETISRLICDDDHSAQQPNMVPQYKKVKTNIYQLGMADMRKT